MRPRIRASWDRPGEVRHVRAPCPSTRVGRPGPPASPASNALADGNATLSRCAGVLGDERATRGGEENTVLTSVPQDVFHDATSREAERISVSERRIWGVCVGSVCFPFSRRRGGGHSSELLTQEDGKTQLDAPQAHGYGRAATPSGRRTNCGHTTGLFPRRSGRGRRGAGDVTPSSVSVRQASAVKGPPAGPCPGMLSLQSGHDVPTTENLPPVGKQLRGVRR